jgi:hypothetical protein
LACFFNFLALFVLGCNENVNRHPGRWSNH